VNFANFDFHRDVRDTVDDRLAEMLNANSTDIGAFRGHGGKLLSIMAGADPLIPSQSSINYFNALLANDSHGFQQNGFQQASFAGVAGRRWGRTQSYAGCSWCPGCITAPAGPAQHPSMRSRRSSTWVETGVAPETIVRHQVRQRHAARGCR